MGDAYFQHKSFARIREFKAAGTTLLFVSHSAAVVKSICERAVLLDGGLLVRDGSPDQVFDYYNALVASRTLRHEYFARAMPTGRVRATAGRPWKRSTLLCGGKPDRAPSAAASPRRCAYALRAVAAVADLTVGFLIRDALGNDMFGTNTYHLQHRRFDLAQGAEFVCDFDIRRPGPRRGALQHERGAAQRHDARQRQLRLVGPRADVRGGAGARAAFDRRRRARRHMQDGGACQRNERTQPTRSTTSAARIRENSSISPTGRFSVAHPRTRTRADAGDALTGGTRPLVLGAFGTAKRAARAPSTSRIASPLPVQRLFRIPVIGAALEWASAVVRLPRTLRFFRGAVETQAVRQSALQQQFAAEHAALVQRTADAERRLVDAERTLDSAIFEARAVKELAERTRTRVDAIHPPPLAETMVFPGGPLAAIARNRAGTLAWRAHRFTVRAHAVRAVRVRFLRLAYGRSEAADLSRLRRSGSCARCTVSRSRMRARRIPADPQGSRRREYRRRRQSRSAGSVASARLHRFRAGPGRVLEHEGPMFSGASVLQVAEHLPPLQIEQVLSLIAQRLVPGAVLIVETPNPLSSVRSGYVPHRSNAHQPDTAGADALRCGGGRFRAHGDIVPGANSGGPVRRP